MKQAQQSSAVAIEARNGDKVNAPVEPSTPAPDIVSRIVAIQGQMSKGEGKLARAVLDDINFAVHAATVDLAKKAGVSLPTVTRFCRTIGCTGVSDFKLSLAKVLAVGDRYLARMSDSSSGKGEIGKDNVISSVCNSAQLALATVSDQLDHKVVDKATTLLLDAKRIFVFGGGGGSSVVAEDTQYRLFRLGLSISSCNDSQLQLMIASTLQKGDVLFAISTGGRYSELVKAAEIAKQYGADVVALTASGSPLSQAANLTINVHVPEGQDILVPTASRYALLAAIDIIATKAATLLGSVARENLRRIKYQLVSNRDGDDSLPLGD